LSDWLATRVVGMVVFSFENPVACRITFFVLVCFLFLSLVLFLVAYNMPDTNHNKEEETTIGFDKTTSKGKPDHLFQACMRSIRSAHFRSNRIRAALVIGGLFTDPLVYREVISIFYVMTRELERKLQEIMNNNKKKDGSKTTTDQELCAKILSLPYSFTEGYEQDLEVLYHHDPDWKKQVMNLVEHTPAAKHYHDKIQNMTKGSELCGAVCVLWGALIIGGGAMAMPKIKKLCGAVNLFQDVVGPNREERRLQFVQVWDSLAEPGTVEFEEIVQSTQECMQCNNNVLVIGTEESLVVELFAWGGTTGGFVSIVFCLWK
jgi:hypothetical protein